MEWNNKQKTREGITLNYIDEGQGQAVLLVHGFPDSCLMWRHQIPALVAAGYRVIASDNRGLGQSDAPADIRSYALEEMTADLVAILDDCDVKRAAVVGHDWGAAICWALVDGIGDRATCFVPLAVGAPQCYAHCDDIRQKEIGWYTLMFQMEGTAERLLEAEDWKLFRQWTRHHSETEHWISGLSREGRLTSALAIYRANILEILMSDREYFSVVPTLGLWSTKDAYLVEEQMIVSGRYVKNQWRYERVEYASHWMMLDRPDYINRVLLNFIGEHHPGG
jgi:pimeloyl-ACP methyl ester carboxylesterase